jgi:predicted protein tyrosine phosphatase
MTLHLLFICSRNQWRSPTAEQVFRRQPCIEARSAGTSPKARRTVSLSDVDWADMVFVMEPKHASRLRAAFRQSLRYKALHVLDIPDEYRYMDPELVEILNEAVGPYLPTGKGADCSGALRAIVIA